MSAPTKSPIKDKPLRMPGQSLEEERQRLIDDKVMPAVLSRGLRSSLHLWNGSYS